MLGVTDELRVFQAHIFHALAHPTRLAIVEALRRGDVRASALPGQVQVDAANLSVHLTVLRTRQIVNVRTSDNQVYYSLRDPVLLQVVDLLKQAFDTSLGQSQDRFADEDSEP